MNRILTVAASILVLSSLAYCKEDKSNTFDRAEYLQGTSSGQRKAAPPVKGTLRFAPDQRAIEFLDSKGASTIRINYDSIKAILYEQTSKPRYAEAVLISPLFIFSSSKKHYLTVQYTDEAGAGQYAIFHLDKGNVRDAVATAEAQTGKKVELVAEK